MPAPIQNQGYGNRPLWEGRKREGSFECNLCHLQSPLRVRNAYPRREGGTHSQDCPWDGTTRILRKDVMPVETRSRSRENRPPWKNRRECSGSLTCSLRRPLPPLRVQSLPYPMGGGYHRQIVHGTAAHVSRERTTKAVELPSRSSAFVARKGATAV